MPIENSEKVSVSVNTVKYFLKSIKIFIMLPSIPISNHSHMQGSVTNALMASHGPSVSIPGSRKRCLGCSERSGTKF